MLQLAQKLRPTRMMQDDSVILALVSNLERSFSGFPWQRLAALKDSAYCTICELRVKTLRGFAIYGPQTLITMTGVETAALLECFAFATCASISCWLEFAFLLRFCHQCFSLLVVLLGGMKFRGRCVGAHFRASKKDARLLGHPIREASMSTNLVTSGWEHSSLAT